MTNKYFQSTKRFTGYSVAFRQYKATHSHCQYLHGYDLEFIATFKGLLDDKNWIIDFGLFKNNGINEPSFLNYVAQSIAECLNKDINHIKEITINNTKEFFSI